MKKNNYIEEPEVRLHSRNPNYIQADEVWPTTTLDGRLNLKTKEVIKTFGSPRIFQRVVFHKWLTPLCKSRDCLYPVSRVLEVQNRLVRGQLPPLLPSEIRQRKAGGE